MNIPQEYEALMSRVVCPQRFKTYSEKSLVWLKNQLDQGRIRDRILKVEIQVFFAKIRD